MLSQNYQYFCEKWCMHLKSKSSKELKNGTDILAGHVSFFLFFFFFFFFWDHKTWNCVLITNSRTAWPIQILMPFLNSLDNLTMGSYYFIYLLCFKQFLIILWFLVRGDIPRKPTKIIFLEKKMFLWFIQLDSEPESYCTFGYFCTILIPSRQLGPINPGLQIHSPFLSSHIPPL